MLPTTRAILWSPLLAGGDRPTSGAYPLFLEQKAIGALQAHFEAAPTQAILGFLVGDLYVCPSTQVRYAVVDSTIRLNQAIYGDKTLVVVSRLWDRIQEELRRVRGQLIGWYHSHPPLAVELAPGDVETHQQYFQRRWQAAVVLGADADGPAAGIFRPGPSPTWSSVSLPFYELIDGNDRLAGGRKRSVLPWKNFVTDDPAMTREEPRSAPAPQPAPASRATIEVVGGHQQATPAAPRPTPAPKREPPPPPAPPPPSPAPPPPRKSAPAPPAIRDLPMLDAAPAEEPPPRRPSEPIFTPVAASHEPPEPAAPPVLRSAPKPVQAPPLPPRPSPRAARRPAPAVARPHVKEPGPRRGRGWLVAFVLLLVAAGGAGWYLYYGPGEALRARLFGSGGGPAPIVRQSDTTLVGLVRLSDSLAQAVRRYRERAKLFDSRQIDCRALAPGLATVEDRLTAYSRYKAKVPLLDSVLLVKDQILTAGSDSVERHFDRSGCPRP